MTNDPIDAAVFAELQASTDAEFVVELLDAFLADAPLLLSNLRTALAAGDAVTFRRTAHSLKSNGNAFGALEFGALARELEEAGMPAVGEQAESKLQALEEAYATAASALRALCHG